MSVFDEFLFVMAHDLSVPAHHRIVEHRQTLKSKINYIANQMHHHRGVEFQPEYRLFLEEHDQQYDERYVWD